MPAPASPFRVLLVDDEPVIRELVQAMLEGGGVEVRCVEDGGKAVPEAIAYRPDLVLLDIILPGLDGLSVLRLLRADPSFATTPIYMLTARVRPTDHAAASRAGASGYIQKPFKGQALQELVEDLRRAASR
ncbi:MAG: response regulator [Anaeromyxobacter sp.]|nr:response regulator [Anaeromyxobacter sp.]MBL0276604.1 response regulator [Anaeromyxobacter sp.]